MKISSYSPKDKLYRKQIPVNSYARLKLETDVANDYFDRASENGELKMTPDIVSSFHLWDGIITVKLVPPQGVKVGEIQKCVIEVTRPYGDSLFVEFEVEYTHPIQTQINPPPPPAPPKGKAYKLPEPIFVYKEEANGRKSWAQMSWAQEGGWTGEDIANVAPSGGTNGDEQNLDVYINMDADILHDYLRRQQVSQKQQELIERSWQTSIFLNSLVLYNDLSKLEKEEILPDVMKSISKITLDLMRNEPLLKEVEMD